jgi:hypothetical protein
MLAQGASEARLPIRPAAMVQRLPKLPPPMARVRTDLDPTLICHQRPEKAPSSRVAWLVRDEGDRRIAVVSRPATRELLDLCLKVVSNVARWTRATPKTLDQAFGPIFRTNRAKEGAVLVATMVVTTLSLLTLAAFLPR